MLTTVEAVGPQDTMGHKLRQLPRAFWMLNVMEMFERLAYYGVRVVIPIYIAQADEIHGLHFTQSQKGLIFMMWALVQTGVPIFSGGFADRYGYKRTIAVSIAIKVAGYLLMATQREFWPFTIGCLVLALGTAIFKPGHPGFDAAAAQQGQLFGRLGRVLHAGQRRRISRPAVSALSLRRVLAGGVLRLRRDRVT